MSHTLEPGAELAQAARRVDVVFLVCPLSFLSLRLHIYTCEEENKKKYPNDRRIQDRYFILSWVAVTHQSSEPTANCAKSKKFGTQDHTQSRESSVASS